MNHFIRGNFISDLALCDEIIDFHKNCKNKFAGLIGRDGLRVDTEVKDSTDCILKQPLSGKYFLQLEKIVDDYVSTFIHAVCNGDWAIIENINIQHYAPGQGFKAWHCERPSVNQAARHLVFMTYLNDVTDGGETEFFYQEMKVRPEKGLTLIWPADWTFTHRGIPSLTQEKYIVTGWFNFAYPNTQEQNFKN